MVEYREILRQHSLGSSKTSIAQSIHSSRNTVREVLEAAAAKNIHWPIDPDITNKDLELLLFPDKYKAVSLYVEPDYAYIHRELAKRGVTMTLLWEEYCSKCHAEGRTPYQSTQFGEKYRKWARVTKATMRIQHKPGDAMEVDWAGNTISVFDPVTGEEGKAYLFIAVLPCSCYVYAEACSDMKTENWLQCHINAYRYFGGVARLLIPDNCKTATTSNTRYDTILNHSYNELAEHYGTAVVPARVRKPKDKSHAEGSVRFAETWIIAALRDRKFFSLKDYDADSVLQNQIAIVREVYDGCQEIKATAAELNLAELKVRKLLITGNIISYEQTDTIKDLQREGKTMDQIIEITGLSRASINGYLPYTKVPYKEAEISSNAEWCNAYRKRKAAVEALKENKSEKQLWECIELFQGYSFRTVTGLKYSYTLKKSRNGSYTKELFIDRRESSKSLAWSSILLAMQKVDTDKVYEKPKAIGDIRGISYIYPMLWRFGLIAVPEEVELHLQGKKKAKSQVSKT